MIEDLGDKVADFGKRVQDLAAALLDENKKSIATTESVLDALSRATATSLAFQDGIKAGGTLVQEALDNAAINIRTALQALDGKRAAHHEALLDLRKTIEAAGNDRASAITALTGPVPEEYHGGKTGDQEGKGAALQ